MENKRDSGIYFKVSDQDRDLIKRKMELAGIRNTSAYLRKMAIDGYVLNLDIPELKEIAMLLRMTSNNVNQIAKRVNAGGGVYAVEVEGI